MERRGRHLFLTDSSPKAIIFQLKTWRESVLKRDQINQWLNYWASLARGIKALLSRRERFALEPTTRFRRIAVLGNGPSLNQDWTRVLQGYDATIVVNFFVKSEKYSQLRPNFYAFADPWFWIPKEDEANRNAMEEFRNHLTEKTNWPITFILPWRANGTEFSQFLMTLPGAQIRYYNDLPGFYSRSWPIPALFQANLLSFSPETVLNLALYAALQLRPEQVDIYGADQSWHEDTFVGEDNWVRMRDTHFYESGPEAARRLYEDKKCQIPLRMSRMYFSLHLAFLEFDRLAEYAKDLNIPVYNCSSKSYLDMFKRRGSRP